MTTETTMTDAATTTESVTASETATDTATAADTGSQQQAATATTTETTQATEQAQAQTGAPEKYEFVAPEGQEFDAKVIAEYSAVAKELNMPQESAQKMLDRLAPAMQAKQIERMEAVRSEWIEQSKTDTEFGGSKMDENIAVAKKALDTFGSPELRELLNETGLGNHPEIIRAFYRAGKAIKEDSFVGGKAAAPSDAKSFYPNSNMN